MQAAVQCYEVHTVLRSALIRRLAVGGRRPLGEGRGEVEVVLGTPALLGTPAQKPQLDLVWWI